MSIGPFVWYFLTFFVGHQINLAKKIFFVGLSSKCCNKFSIKCDINTLSQSYSKCQSLVASKREDDGAAKRRAL